MDLKKILTAAGYKLTRPRQEVFSLLEKEQHPISAQALHKKIASVDQVSVYRVLKLFETLGVVQSEVIKKETFYCLAEHPHHHIFCRKCGYTEAFECSKQQYGDFKNFTDIHHQLTLIGTCNKCNTAFS